MDFVSTSNSISFVLDNDLKKGDKGIEEIGSLEITGAPVRVAEVLIINILVR